MSSKGAPFDLNQIPQPSPQALRQAVSRIVALLTYTLENKQMRSVSGISCLKGAANGDETKDLKLELTPGTSIEIFPDNGTIATDLEAPPQTEIKDKGVEDKQSSIATGSQCVTTQLIAELSKMWEENHVQSNSEIPRKDATSPSNEGPSNEAMNAIDIPAPSKQKNDHSTNFEG
ncbi:hypothetical protein IFM89_004725 [Coptis chinensis]|uniref:Uncharacterized protein n=1 Tax=Coptis chinensis TaxID=261450 RepID=A0A835GXH7_9MAGN|nr:hypothetical protein IFM89_004725 [Coptis chinensis]